MSPRRLAGPCPTPGCPERAGQCDQHDNRSAAKRDGKAHERERAAWKRRMDRGEVVLCRRCKQPIEPDQPWDLGHPVPKHPEHRGHNRGTMGRDRS